MASNRKILISACSATFVLAALPFGLSLLGVHADDLSRDVTDTGHLPWWTGALSTAAVVMWSAAAAACALAAAAVSPKQRGRSRFLIATAALLVLAALDDALQLHETVGPEELGVPEAVCYATLGAAAALWGLRFRNQIRSSRLWLLLATGTFFAGSLLSDILAVGPTAAEDWLKNSGIAILLIWCVDTSLSALQVDRAPAQAISAPRRRHARVAATPPPAR